MIKMVRMTNQHKNWYRMFCHEKQSEYSIAFTTGINILVSENGEGKTTLLNAIEEKAFNADTAGVQVATSEESKGKKIFFFSVKDLEPQKSMRELNPLSENHLDEMGFWFGRQALSHGQSTHELLEDIKTLAEQDDTGCIVIDEPELALDAKNLFEFILGIKPLAEKTQFIITSHHPMLVLNMDFNVVNLNGNSDYPILMRQ